MKERSFTENMKRFLRPMKKTPYIFIRGFGVYILWGINGVIHVLFLEKIIYTLETGNIDLFNLQIGVYIIYFIIFEILFWVNSKNGWTLIYSTFLKNIQGTYLDKFIQIDNNDFESKGVGKTVTIVNKGMITWAQLINSLLHNGGPILVSFLFTVYMIGNFSNVFAIIFVLLYILFHFISIILNAKILTYRRRRIEYANMHTKNIVKILMSKFEILQSNKLKKETNILDKYQDKEIEYNNKMAYYMSGFYRIPAGSMTILLIIVFVYLGKGYFHDIVTLSEIVGLTGALILMQRSIIFSVDYYKNFTKDFTDIENFWDFFDNAPQIQGYETGEKFSHKKGEINIEKLNFGYIENKNIFTDFSLNIAGEKVLALVGDSGSGKSTLAKMIAGYMRPNTGEIIVDNQKLSEVSLKSYYKDIGYLTQDPSVFDGSILENLTYALDEKVDEIKLKEIIIQAKCEFIYDLPNGLETQIGERGVKLSGGQKQRLAIAKIFLKDPKIIILDEPTSALDSFSEEQITKAMKNLFENRTVIVIAHRLQTVKHADRILVLEDGKIVEDGNHDELVKKEGKYAKMLELQSGF